MVKKPKSKRVAKRKKRAAAKKKRTRPEGDKLHRLASEVNDASRKVEELVAPFLIDEPLKTHAYTIKKRVKSTIDIKRKVLRKRRGAHPNSKNWSYDPTHVTDGCGFRVVTIFQRDILEVVGELIRMIKHEGPYGGKNPIKQNSLKEVTIFTNRPIDEEGSIHVRAKQLFDAAGFKAETAGPENRKTGYSSVHLVVEVPVKVQKDDGTEHKIDQLMEIQVRDIFEEAWGEIDHALRYAQERDDQRLEDHPFFDNWKPHLNALKTFADGCSQHASLIKTHAIDSARIQKTLVDRRPTEEPETVIGILTDTLPEEFHGDIRNAFEAQRRAIATTRPEERKEAFDDAYELFNSLYEATTNYHEIKTTDGRNIGYRLSMELAYSFVPESDEEIDVLINFYTRAQSSFPNDVVAFYRHGMLAKKRGNLDEALELFSKAEKAVPNDQTLEQSGWIRSALPRNIGFIHWKKAEQLSDDPERQDDQLQLFEMAFDKTLKGLAEAEAIDPNGIETRQCLNNLTWYVLGYLKTKTTGVPNKISRPILGEKLQRLKRLTDFSDPDSLYDLHTLELGFHFLGRPDEKSQAAAAAGKIMYEIARQHAGDPDLRVDQVRENLPEEFHDIHDDTLRLLFPTTPGINAQE